VTRNRQVLEAAMRIIPTLILILRRASTALPPHSKETESPLTSAIVRRPAASTDRQGVPHRRGRRSLRRVMLDLVGYPPTLDG